MTKLYMNFKEAIAAHVKWKETLSSYILDPDHSLAPSEICKDNQCTLGKWIYGTAAEFYGNTPEYEVLRKDHADFHRVTADIVRILNQGIKKTDLQLFGENTEFDNVSQKIIKTLENFDQYYTSQNTTTVGDVYESSSGIDKKILENFDFGYLLINKNGLIEGTTNKITLDYLSYNPSGRSFSEFFDKKKEAEIIRNISLGLLELLPQVLFFNLRWLHFRYKKLVDSNYFLVTINDITGFKGHQSWNKSVLNTVSSVAATVTSDANGLITGINKHAELMLGYSAEECVDKLTVAIFHDSNEVINRSKELGMEPSFEAVVFQAKIHGTETREWTLLRKDGDKFSAELTISVIKESGHVIGYLGTIVDLTEQNRLEEERRRLEQLASDIQRVAKVGGWELDVKSHDLRWTDGVYRIHAFPVGSPITVAAAIKFYADNDQKRVSTAVNMAISNGASFDGEFELIDARGNHKWVRSKGEPVVNKENEVIKVIGTIQDITVRKQLEVLNLRTNAETKSFESALNKYAIVAKTDLKGTIIYVNDKFCEISKYNRNELLGQNHRILNSGYHTKEFFQGMWKTIRGGESWRDHVRNRAKDGSYYWVDTTIAPIVVDNIITEYVAFRYDITKEKNRHWISSEISHLRAIYTRISKDKHGFFEYLLHKIIKLTKSEFGVIGNISIDGFNIEASTFPDKKAPTDLDTLLGNVIRTGKIQVSKTSLGISNGHHSLNSFMGLPIYYAGKLFAIVGVVGLGDDYNEEHFNEYNPILDVLGEMIHAFKLEEELKFQTKLSQHNAKLASIGQLAAGVGHEINNPLAIAKGLLAMAESDLAKSGHIDQNILNKLLKVDLALERIEHIVKGLRSFARSDEASYGRFNVYDLIDETYSMMKEIYTNEGINFTSYGKKNDLDCFGSRGRLQQVLVNLISNAKDATEGLSRREISLYYEEKKSEVVITVSDNGHGIPEDKKEKIFEPFFTTKELHKGTGIGLSLVAAMIKEHEGKIEVESKIGLGSKFIITLPAKYHSQVQAP